MTFDLYINEALFLTEDEKDVLAGLMANIRSELQSASDTDTDR